MFSLVYKEETGVGGVGVGEVVNPMTKDTENQEEVEVANNTPPGPLTFTIFSTFLLQKPSW